MRGSAVISVAVVVAALLVAAGPEPALAQCAMCKTVVNGSAEGQAVAGDLNRAILMMLAAPYLVFGTLAALVFRKPLLAAVRARTLGPRERDAS